MNGILHHCSLSTVAFSSQEILSDDEDTFDDDLKDISIDQSTSGASVRPGIVHRLDKGTSGLLVVAKVMNSKDDHYFQLAWPEALLFCLTLCALSGRMNILMHIYLINSNYTQSRGFMLVLLLECPPRFLDVLTFQLVVIQITGFVWLLYQEQRIVNRVGMLLVGDLWPFLLYLIMLWILSLSCVLLCIINFMIKKKTEDEFLSG